MSRIAKHPVVIPEGVTVTVNAQRVTAKGKLGELSVDVNDVIKVEQKDSHVVVSPLNDNQKTRALWGLSRTLIQNIVTGVHEGFVKELELKGVGYRVSLQGNTLVMNLSLSHDVRVDVPEGLKAEVANQTEIKITGADKQRVGQFAADLRRLRPPEPYKGKGIRYKGEHISLKEGKKK